MNPRQYGTVALLLAAAGVPVIARQDPAICGTHRDSGQEALFLHRRAARAHARRAAGLRPAMADAAGAAADMGDIAVIGDGDGVVGRPNPFDLDQRTVRFLPADSAAASYRFESGSGSYDTAAPQAGVSLTLGDDDSRAVDLPFAFPFFGSTYTQIFVNSDGNLTFGGGDAASTDRSLGRLTTGPPRIAPLFTDLDPSAPGGSVFVTSSGDQFTVTWDHVRVYSSAGLAAPQTFQVRLYSDGRVEMTWAGISAFEAVVGIAPGHAQGGTTLAGLDEGSDGQYNGAIAERFSASSSVDIVMAAQKFYSTHEDAYDYLVIYNAEDVNAATGAVAYEVTTRNSGSGYAEPPIDIGQQFGSGRRLQAVMNMGPLSEYPGNPYARVPLRSLTGDTPLTILGHEAGHLFLAYASVGDPSDSSARPLLGRQMAHWSFLFNSEASLLEGARISDNGAGVSPRFRSVATVEGYSPLDQYLMGFRAPEDVPPTFLVTHSTLNALTPPQPGLSFDGDRRDITVSDIIAAVGPRAPDYTIAQRRFRFAFVLIVPEGSTAAPAQVAQVDRYRSLFESFFASAASDRAAAETSLRRALHVSAFPAVDMAVGDSVEISVSIEHPRDLPLTITLSSDADSFSIPDSITIASGDTQASFSIAAASAGIATLTLQADGGEFETVSIKARAR